ncbi:interferon alpha-G-like [Seriola dumerili]|uniref:interferon alpha-G-like n=1 Tax=Seriola dumerili TaxID=41447 RepID=UPI000BBEFC11|nr:interferon alpha-G-like [Seriola dumerili]
MKSSSVPLILLQLCSLQLMVVAMPTCQLLEDVVQTTHNLLRDLGGPFPVHCMQYNVNISFPDSAFPAATASHPQCRQALWVVYETLRETQELFQELDLPVGEGGVTWDSKKLADFLNLQYGLVEEGSCLATTKAPGVLSSYFSNVTAFVQQQDSAACGWMALRRDVLWVLKTALHKYHSCFAQRARH